MTRYEQGFMNKCAEYGVDGRYVVQALNKQAAPSWLSRGKHVNSLKRLVAWLSPKVRKPRAVEHAGDIYGLNPLEKFFLKRNFKSTYGPDKLREYIKEQKLNWDVPEGSISGSPSISGSISGEFDRVNPVRFIDKLRLRPGRVAAALGGTGLAAGVASDILKSNNQGPELPQVTPSRSNLPAILAALGLTGAGVGFAGYAAGKRNKKKSKSGKNSDKDEEGE